MAGFKNTQAELEALLLPDLQARFREVTGESNRTPNRKYLIRRIQETLAAKEQAEVAAEVEPTIAAPEAPVEETEVQKPAGNEPTEVAAAAPVESAAPAEAAEAKCGAEECGGCEVCEPADAELTSNQRFEPGGAGEGAVTQAASKKRGRFSGMSVDELQAKYLEVVGRSTSSRHVAYLQWKIRMAEKGRITVGPRQARTTEANTDEAKTLPLRLEAPAISAMDIAWRQQGIPSRTEFLRRAIGHYLGHLGAADAATLFATK